jgi:hypothetical protein
MNTADNAIFRILGRDCTDMHWPAEAGKLIVPGRRHEADVQKVKSYSIKLEITV